MTKVVVVGGEFFNKGAEAMLRTVQAELGSRLAGVEVFLWQASPWDVRPALSAGVQPLSLPPEATRSVAGLVSQGRLVTKPGRGGVAWSLFELTRGPRFSPEFSWGRRSLVNQASEHFIRRKISDLDAVVDISGFAYRDAIMVNGYSRIEPIINYCRKYHKPVVFLPQGWGPFDTEWARSRLGQLLNRVDTRFYSRDPISTAHLAAALEVGEQSISTRPDIVFAFVGGGCEQGKAILASIGCSQNQPIVGLSPNMRVYERTEGHGTGNVYLRSLIELSNHVIDRWGCDVVLQANEVDFGWSRVDDRYLCGLISSAVGRPDRCFPIPGFLTAEETKAVIGCFDFSVSSRFHSAVFALSQGISGLSIGWAHKYESLFSLFDLGTRVIDTSQVAPERLKGAFDNAWSMRLSDRPRIIERSESLRAEVGTLFDEVAEFLVGDKIPSSQPQRAH